MAWTTTQGRAAFEWSGAVVLALFTRHQSREVVHVTPANLRGSRLAAASAAAKLLALGEMHSLQMPGTQCRCDHRLMMHPGSLSPAQQHEQHFQKCLVQLTQVGCHRADTGDCLHTLKMPVKRPSAVAFGGPELKTLYITTILRKARVLRRIPASRSLWTSWGPSAPAASTSMAAALPE